MLFPLSKTLSPLGHIMGGVAPISTPLEIYGSNTKLWLKKSTGLFTDVAKTIPATVNGNSVRAWADQSGNGNDFTQSGAVSLVPTRQDGAVLFDGGDYLFRTDAMGFTGEDKPITFGIVIKPLNIASTQTAFSLGQAATNNPFMEFYVNSKYNWFIRDSVATGALDTGGGTSQTSIFDYITIVINGSEIAIRVNGVAVVSDILLNVGTLTIDRAAVGAFIRNSVTQIFNGYISEIVMCNVASNVEDLHKLEIYLASVAGLSTPAIVLNRGIWSFFGQPHAVRYVGVSDKTYIGVVTSLGRVKIMEYNHATSKMSWPYMLKASLQADDHAQPQILIRNDGKLVVFYCAHNGENMYSRISTNIEDASVWDAEANLDSQFGGEKYSYPTPIQLTGEVNNPIYLFYRAYFGLPAYRPTYFSKSIDGGVTWEAQTKLFNVVDQRPYFQITKNGTTRIDFAITDGQPSEVATNSIYHFYYEAGNYYKSDGTLIGNASALPLTPATVTKVYDGASIKSWVWDIAIDATGKPVIVYATFPTEASDHRYNYARWTGIAWESHEICQAGGPLYAGETHYSGGVFLDHDNVNVVYCSRQVSGQFEIFKYETTDNGANWTNTQLTTGSTLPNFRPVVPLNSSDGLKAIWCYGTYTSYTNYLTHLKSEPQY